jgi:hypothetical protein
MLFRFLLSSYSVQNALFMTEQEHFIPHCRCKVAVKIVRFVLSVYSLTGTCNSVYVVVFRCLQSPHVLVMEGLRSWDLQHLV